MKKMMLTFVLAVAVAACSSGGGGGGFFPVSSKKDNTGTGAVNLWTWMTGTNTVNQAGIYGTKGTPDALNTPGARDGSVSWIDDSGNFWLFGGGGYDSAGNCGNLNDLWKYDSNSGMWMWVTGTNVAGQPGVYGTKGTADPSNMPGARRGSVSWTDGSGNFWLFGGDGRGAAAWGLLNDLWKYKDGMWTWVTGTNVVDQPGVYGAKGTPDPSNVPGARRDAVSWIDNSGNLWLFGGSGIDSAGSQGPLNDLWKYDSNSGMWTWVTGTNVVDQPGVYGAKGTPDPSNMPGARSDSASWTDGSGNFWLFGGDGRVSDFAGGGLNDLWKYDSNSGMWTWVTGTNAANQPGVYGMKGVASASNVPGARMDSVSWTDSSGNLWLFGGSGLDSEGAEDYLNDLWKFDGTNWTWVSGSSTAAEWGVYGTKGTSDESNVPGAREGSVSWTDGSGNLWLFGGYGYDSTGMWESLNDLWRYEP